MRLLAGYLFAALCTQAAFRPLPEVDWSRIKPSMFADSELDLPFYLAHFSKFAGAVEPEGPNRGFIRISVWRAPKDNQPHNARIMENILSLAFFYATDRPWNLYRGDPAVRQRLEAALDFWCRIQSPEGKFSEYAPERWNLAATAFATKFMGQTLRLLRDGPPVDAALMTRVEAAQRKAILCVLRDAQFYEHGRNFSNQFTNVWPGALAWLRLRKDPEVQTLLERRVQETAAEFQSPMGYFYEAGGPDFGYNLGTHHSNLLGAWFYSSGTPLGERFVEEERRFIEWLSYNAVPEGNSWVLNRAIETRQQHPVVSFSYRIPMAEQVPLARAFVPAREDIEAQIRSKRRELERTWPKFGPLREGEFTAFAPYVFLHREQPQWYPTETQKKAAVASMRHLRGTTFVQQRRDSRHPFVVTFVSRPAYYAAFNSGKHIRPQQRYGLGLLWSPGTGVLIQSQSNSADLAWGTRAAGSREVYEAGDLAARIVSDAQSLDPKPGIHDYDGKRLVIEYSLGSMGSKRITFDPGMIHVSIRHPGDFTEQIPALVQPLPQSGQGATTFGAGVRLDTTAVRTVIPGGREIAGKSLTVVALSGRDQLDYTIRFKAPE